MLGLGYLDFVPDLLVFFEIPSTFWTLFEPEELSGPPLGGGGVGQKSFNSSKRKN